MKAVSTFLKSLYLHPFLFWLGSINILLFLLAYIFPLLLAIIKLLTIVFLVLVILDILILFIPRKAIEGKRITPERLSNGDENTVKIELSNFYNFPVELFIIDEAPVQFQLRKLSWKFRLQSNESHNYSYSLRPVKRGEYHFNALNVYVASPLRLVRRRYRFNQNVMVPVYPSYIQMRKYQLMAVANRLSEAGIKKIRRLGHTTEFEQIKEYVRGDDYRTVNWKATGRSGKLMVNQYTDEKAQNVYCLIDKSRAMKMPFEGMTLLDYAINTSLVLSNIAVYKQDRAGLLTFTHQIDQYVPSGSRPTQMNLIMDVLFNQQTQFLEPDYERLYIYVKHQISHRSLLILFTNFESLSNLRRQMPYLQKLARLHLLLVIFFENTELKALENQEAQKLEDIYIKTMGEQFAYEKRQMVLELERHGILSVLTPPEQLTVNAVNKYLSIKARAMI